jgi:hypothetical protein
VLGLDGARHGGRTIPFHVLEPAHRTL